MVSMVRLVWDISRVEREFKFLQGYRIRFEDLQWSEMKRRTKRFHASEWEIKCFKISGKLKIREWLERRKPLAPKSNCELQTWGKISWVDEETQNASDKTNLRNFKTQMRMQMFRKTGRKLRISDKVKERRANAIKRKNSIINFKKNCSMSKEPSDRIICLVI